jgi:hypothetical protein
MANSGAGISSFLSGGYGDLLGGLGGAVSGLLPSGPTTTNTNQSSSGTSNQTGDFSQLLNSLINTLQNSNQQTNTSGATNGTSFANLGPQQQALLNQLTQRYQQLSAPSLTGYAAQQTAGINKNADLQSQAVNNIMASRGLSTSPAAGTAAAGIEAGRVGQINQMQAGIPLLQSQLNTTNLGATSSFMSSLPTLLGTSNIGNTAGQQSQAGQTTGQTIQGQTSSGTSNQTGATNQTATGSSTTQQQGSVAGGIAGLLGGLFSDKRLKKDVKPIGSALDKIVALQPKKWHWKGGEFEDTGLLAQDLQKVLPELVHKDEETDYLQINYAGLISTLVGAVQEIHAEAQ